MPAGNAYPSGHLVPSPFLGLAYAPVVETRFPELALSLLDFSPWIPLGTFSILFNYKLRWLKGGKGAQRRVQITLSRVKIGIISLKWKECIWTHCIDRVINSPPFPIYKKKKMFDIVPYWYAYIWLTCAITIQLLKDIITLTTFWMKIINIIKHISRSFNRLCIIFYSVEVSAENL